MNTLINKLYLILLIALLPLAVSSCQNSHQEDTADTNRHSEKPSQSTDTKVAGLLNTLGMHYFKKPIQAPEFALESVKGGTVSLSQYRGSVVFVSFWATW